MAKNVPAAEKRKKAKNAVFKTISLRTDDIDAVLQKILADLESLKVLVTETGPSSYTCQVSHNRWSRKSRRGGAPQECNFDFQLSLRNEHINFSIEASSQHDESFVSLVSHLQRKHGLKK